MGNALTCKAGCLQKGSLVIQANNIYNVGSQNYSLLSSQVCMYFLVSSQGEETVDGFFCNMINLILADKRSSPWKLLFKTAKKDATPRHGASYNNAGGVCSECTAEQYKACRSSAVVFLVTRPPAVSRGPVWCTSDPRLARRSPLQLAVELEFGYPANTQNCIRAWGWVS